MMSCWRAEGESAHLLEPFRCPMTRFSFRWGSSTRSDTGHGSRGVNPIGRSRHSALATTTGTTWATGTIAATGRPQPSGLARIARLTLRAAVRTRGRYAERPEHPREEAGSSTTGRRPACSVRIAVAVLAPVGVHGSHVRGVAGLERVSEPKGVLTPLHTNALLAASGNRGVDFAGGLWDLKGCAGPVGPYGVQWARVRVQRKSPMPLSNSPGRHRSILTRGSSSPD
jgi:hypothetical protein